MKTRALVLLFLAASPQLALGQDISTYNKGLSAFNNADFDESARLFYELVETTTDPELRAKGDYYLAQSFARKDLWATAMVYYSIILKLGRAHPYYLKAVEGLVNAQQQLDDQYLIPNRLNNDYNDEWATLPLEVIARINYLVGGISLRRAKFEEAKAFLEAVPKESRVFAKARYLLGIVLVDPRYPGGQKAEEAIATFEAVQQLTDTKYLDLPETKQLATLAIGRAYFGLGQYQKATETYEQIPRFSKFWDQALFENGWARFQNDDYGGALGSLQALHAPQFAGAFQPESWQLKATVYFFNCLYEEAQTALKAFDEIYLPMAASLRPLLEGDRDFAFYYKLIAENSEKVPRPVLLWVRGNERMLGLFRMLERIEKEKDAISHNQAWRKLGQDAVAYLDQNRTTLVQIAGQVAKARLKDALQVVRTHADNAEIVRFETSKAEKELAEAGVDQRKLLARQALYRPAMPAEDWDYWKFQGEFWIDEIGYYQYTLKKGCPVQASE